MIDARPVRGRFRTLRSWANVALVALLFAIPWIRLNGEPLVLLDIPARRFHVFGLVIFPQELYFLWLILAALALSLFFFTSLLGRVWCGWACPQTVFTDIFAGVGRRIQGWRDSRPPGGVALWRRVATHATWLAMSWLIGFHLVAYFRSPYELIGDLAHEGRLHPTVFAFHMLIMLLTYLDFVLVKQTFCRFLCPYARFQGVLFDSDTLVIGYDGARGEPRGKKGSTTGDCVDCGLCVAVCPTGIDIRNGMQMECIACTQCIDACDGVMERLGRARNLIGYRSLVSLTGERAPRLLRPRVAAYGALLAATCLAFAVLIERRELFDFSVNHNASQLYTTAADGRIGNAFTLRIENRGRSQDAYHLSLEGDDRFELISGLDPIPVPASGTTATRVFVLPRLAGPPRSGEIRFVLEPVGGSRGSLTRSARFVAPEGNGA